MAGQPSIACAACGAALPDEHCGPADRVPCPACGSISRAIGVEVHEVVGAPQDHIMAAGKSGAKTKGPRRRPLYEFKTGESRTKSTGGWANHTMDINRRDPDKANWHYRELITDTKTGKIYRDVDEPLSAHQGRGDAKPKGQP